MGEIGTSVNVPSWPVTLDTNSTVEVDTVPGMSIGTIVRAATINDVSAIALRLESALSGKWIDAAYYSSIVDADAAAVAAGKTLMISTAITLPSGTITLSATLEFKRSGSIAKGSATSLTITGPIVGNPMHQIFSGFAAGEVVFGVGIQIIYPEWWGTAVNTDCTAAIQSAINAVPLTSGAGFPEIQLPPYQFITSYTITVPYEIPITGIGNQTTGTAFNYTGTGTCLQGTFAFGARCWSLKKFKIRTGDNVNTALSGIEVTNGLVTGDFSNIEITGNTANTNLDYGINIKGNAANANATVNLFKNVTVQKAGVGIKVGQDVVDGYGSNTIIEGGILLNCRTACYQLSGDVNTIIGGDYTAIGTGVVGLYDSSHIKANTIIGAEMNAAAGVPVIRLTAATAGDVTALFLFGVRMRSGAGIEDLGGSNRIVGYNDYTSKFNFWSANIDNIGNLTLPKLIQMSEMAEPSNAGTNDAFLFLKDNGGKTQLCAKFGSGVAQVIATEP